MKIELIGTGSESAPQLSSSTLIDERILVDAGNGIVKKLKQLGHSILDIESHIVTHLHGDHFADLPFLIVEKGRGNTGETMYIYGPKGTEQKIKDLYNILVFPFEFDVAKERANVKFIEFDKMINEKIGEKTYITSFDVEHGNCKPAYGYVIQKDSFKIGFSGDRSYCESIPKIVEQSDIAILDMCFIKAQKGHMGLEDIIKITEEYPNKKIVTTHMSEDVRKLAKDKKIQNLIIPDDGEIINL